MTRDEILEKSRQENNGRNYAGIENAKIGVNAGWIVTVCISAIVAVVNVIVFNRIPNELFFAVMSGLATMFFIKYSKLHNRHEIIVAIFYTISALAFFTGWIIQLVRA